jgi:hypothetical protein
MPCSAATAKRFAHITDYTITRTGEDAWIVNHVPCAGLNAAAHQCMVCDEARLFEWDLSMPGQCRDGLEGLKVGESIVVSHADMLEDDD